MSTDGDGTLPTAVNPELLASVCGAGTTAGVDDDLFDRLVRRYPNPKCGIGRYDGVVDLDGGELYGRSQLYPQDKASPALKKFCAQPGPPVRRHSRR
jgi:hypothetical protein